MTDQIMFDARWIGVGGIGRVTSQIHDGLSQLQPAGQWSVWAREPIEAWQGATLVRARATAPQQWAGQRSWFGVPDTDIALFPANLRPLRRVGRASVCMIYDTIPLRHEPSAARRRAMRVMFKAAAHFSTRILTISEHSARTIVADLGVAPEKVRAVNLPYDRALVDAVRAERALAARPTIVFVGRFGPHKNLDRLIEAFARSTTAKDGGRLVLAGGSGSELERLRDVARSCPVDVDVRGGLTESELVSMYASAWAVAFPSLEEGFGLPVIEASAAGIPVVAGDGGAIPEVVGGQFGLVESTSVASIAAGIDDAVAMEGRVGTNVVAWAEGFPTAVDLAREFVAEAESLSR